MSSLEVWVLVGFSLPGDTSQNLVSVKAEHIRYETRNRRSLVRAKAVSNLQRPDCNGLSRTYTRLESILIVLLLIVAIIAVTA